MLNLSSTFHAPRVFLGCINFCSRREVELISWKAREVKSVSDVPRGDLSNERRFLCRDSWRNFEFEKNY